MCKRCDKLADLFHQRISIDTKLSALTLTRENEDEYHALNEAWKDVDAEIGEIIDNLDQK